jgi:ubiquinol-cytochrome c reductase iron-sulfur subunit
MADLAHRNLPSAHNGETRRDFLILTATAIGGVGVATTIWPFIDSLNPSRDTLALSMTEVDLAPVQPGQRLTVAWRGKPVFIAHRTPEEIKAAEDVDLSQLRDPQKDSDRVKKREWLVLVGVCTHLGCIPLGQGTGDDRGPYGGWFCPCHGSIYDTSGRIRQGPAPLNLWLPGQTNPGVSEASQAMYKFTSDTTITWPTPVPARRTGSSAGSTTACRLWRRSGTTTMNTRRRGTSATGGISARSPGLCWW